MLENADTMHSSKSSPNKALVRMQTALRFVCAAQRGSYVFA
jgi:hypothetical protein